MTETLSELLDECESALRLHRFAQKVYSNLIDHCPEALDTEIRAVNAFLFREIQDTLEDELTKEEARALCALIEGLKEHRNGDLF